MHFFEAKWVTSPPQERSNLTCCFPEDVTFCTVTHAPCEELSDLYVQSEEKVGGEKPEGVLINSIRCLT